jgi:hypothetical protein
VGKAAVRLVMPGSWQVLSVLLEPEAERGYVTLTLLEIGRLNSCLI